MSAQAHMIITTGGVLTRRIRFLHGAGRPSRSP